MSTRRLLFIFLPILILVLYLLNMARFAGMYVSYEPTSLANCSNRYTLPGAEDFVSLPGKGILISATDRRNHQPDFKDGIYWLQNGGEPIYVSMDAPDTFHPHGLSLLQSDNKTLLYAISHDGELYSGEEGHSIEVFEFTNTHELKHLRSIRHTDIRSPNDLAVVGLDQFYVSNDQHFLKGFMRTLEQYLLLPITNVVYYDNGKTVKAASGLKYANGVTASKNNNGKPKMLYVSEVMGRKVNQFSIDSKTAELSHIETFLVGGSPDNISIADNGDLVIAVIADGFSFQAHSSGKADSAPALIRRLNTETGELNELFYNEDGFISGATAGLMHDGKLFIGTAYDDKLVACDL